MTDMDEVKGVLAEMRAMLATARSDGMATTVDGNIFANLRHWISCLDPPAESVESKRVGYEISRFSNATAGLRFTDAQARQLHDIGTYRKRIEPDPPKPERLWVRIDYSGSLHELVWSWSSTRPTEHNADWEMIPGATRAKA